MKRVGIVFAIFFIAVQVICADEAKYYSDWKTGYKGYAEAEYIGKGDSERYLEELEKAKEELQKVYLDGKYDVSDILKLTKEDLWLCRSASTGGLLPDRTILLDADPALADRRTNGRGGRDRFERESDAFRAALREQFLALADAEPGRIVVVDAARPVEAVTAAVRRALDRREIGRASCRERV